MAAPPHRRRRRRPDRRVGLPPRRHGRRHPGARARPRGRSARRSAPRPRVARISTTGGVATGRGPRRRRRAAAPTVITTAHPQISFLRLLDRARPAGRLRRGRSRRWKSRSGTVKVNLAVDRLPEFTSKPGFDPEVHGGTIVLAESLDDIEGAFQEAVDGQPATLPFADICIPSVFDRLPRARPASTSCRCSPSGSRTPGTPSRARAELDAYADRRRRPHGRGRARLRRLGAAPPGHRPVRDGARVRPDRRQHLPRRADRRADVPRATGCRLRRPAYADPRALPGRLGARTAVAASRVSRGATSSSRSSPTASAAR